MRNPFTLEALEIVQQRLHDCARRTVSLSEVMKVDEAIQCLEEDDRSEIAKEQKAAEDQQDELTEFKKEFKAKKHDSLPKASKNKLKWTGPKAAKWETITQKALKLFLPPGALIWRRRSDGSWNAKFSEFPTHSCCDTAWGSEANAARECVRHCWEWYLVVSGFSEAACPVANVF